MQRYESFGECLKRCLQEEGLSASEAARMVGFRSRNSIFRILSGDAGEEIKLRFLGALYAAIGSKWSEKRWNELQEALCVDRLGPERYRANQAFHRVLHDQEGDIPDYRVHLYFPDGTETEYSLREALHKIASSARAEIVITGCCDSGLARLLEECCGRAGAQGTLAIRHYINTEQDNVTQNILGILPLISRPWYNARLVEAGSCPAEMMAVYGLHAIYVNQWDEEGQLDGRMFIRYDERWFSCYGNTPGGCMPVRVLDQWRFHLELLKPMPQLADGPEIFVEYTARYAELEENCTILSVKPDAHFNCIPADLLEQSILEGFAQSGMAAGPELIELIGALKAVHVSRFDNMLNKNRPTHLVYSLPMMERFMRTGVLSDQFFLQRAYTVEERRQIIQVLLDAMRERPYFNVHFLKEGLPELCYEISCYDGKGVMLMDAYTGYELASDHSEALITLPAFMESFKAYFKDELLAHYVMSRADTMRHMERLLVMKVVE